MGKVLISWTKLQIDFKLSETMLIICIQLYGYIGLGALGTLKLKLI